MKDSDREALEREISRNFSAFRKMKFSPQDKGRVALLRGGKLVEILDSRGDAHKFGKLKFANGEHYSIQEIGVTSVNIYWHFPHAFCPN